MSKKNEEKENLVNFVIKQIIDQIFLFFFSFFFFLSKTRNNSINKDLTANYIYVKLEDARIVKDIFFVNCKKNMFLLLYF